MDRDGSDIERVAGLIADGMHVDWEQDSIGASDETLAALRCLRQIQCIARLHGTQSDEASEPPSSAHLPQALGPGTSWGDLVIIDEIGRGSYGRVYRAEDPTLDRVVALKMIDVSGDADPFAVVAREGRLLARVRHPNVVTVYGARQIGNVVGIWMELVEGKNLADFVEESGPLPLDRALPIVLDLCDGLAAVHEAGLVHRDVKARNVLIQPSRRIVLMDFGTGRNIRETATADLAGTPLYMAPELFRGEPASIQSDVYSVGVLLHYLLTGDHPIRGRSLNTVILEHARAEQHQTGLSLAGIDARAQEVLARALDRDAGTRYASATELASALRALMESTEPLNPRGGTTQLVNSSVWSVPGVVAVFFAGLALAAGWWYTGSGSVGRRGGDSPLTITGHRALTTSSDIDEYPSLSPDGQTIAYSSAQDGGPIAGNWDIWVVGADGSTPRNLTEGHVGADRFPVWSPDGRRIAYWSDRDEGGCDVVSDIGLDRTRVSASHPLHGTRPAWSADGARLACVVNHSRNPVIVITDIATGRRTTLQVPQVQGRIFDPTWSPDGRFVAFVDAPAQSADRSTLRLLDLQSGTTRTLSNGSTNIWSPMWSRDGAHLYFTGNLTGSMDLWQLAMTEGQPTGTPSALSTGAGILSFGLAVDGTRIIFSKGSRAANVWRMKGSASRAGGWSDAQEVTTETALIETIDLAPQSTELVVSSDRGGNPQLWGVPLLHPRQAWRRLVTGAPTQWAGRVSSTGALSFYGLSGASRKIWTSDGSEPAVAVTDGPGEDVFPGWSPDSSTVVFCSNRSGNWDLWTLRLSDRRERRITSDPGDDSFPDWSPDGRHIVFSSTRSGKSSLWIIDMESLRAEPLTKGPAWFGRWSEDTDTVVFIGHGPRANTIWRVDPATRAENMIGDLRGRRGSLGRFALVEAGGLLYFVWESTSSDLWSAEIRNAGARVR